MTPRSIAVALACSGALCAAQAQAPDKGSIVMRFKAADDAVACLSRTKIDEAVSAAKAHDRAKLDQLGCFPVKAGLPAARGPDSKRGDPLWQVVLDPKGAAPITAWAYHTSFVAENGDRLDKDGRRVVLR